MNSSDVYICFGAWKNLKSRIIRWITGDYYSHVWIEYYSKRWGDQMVVHADSKGVIIEPIANFCSKRGFPESSIAYKVCTGDSTLGFTESRFYLGKDYGYTAIVINSIVLLLSRIGIRWLKGIRDINKYICSEFVTLFIKHCGIECNLDPDLTWPGLLKDWIDDHPIYFKRVL